MPLKEGALPPGEERVRRLQIGDWVVDPASDELRRHGMTVRIEPKAMEVLLALAARAGEVVSRQELLTSVWSGMVVGDDALTQAVIKLRKAVGDERRTSPFIETIPKRGYRLVAPVLALDAQEAAAVPPRRTSFSDSAPDQDARQWSWRARRGVWVGSAIGIAVLTGLMLTQRPEEPTAELTAVPLEPAPQGLPTISIQPFEAFGAADQSYLAEGIAADLATDLSRLAGLRVIRATLNDPRREPGNAAARYLASGSVQRVPDRLKINVWLMDARTGQQLWSERYDRPASDLMAVQEDIVARLVAALPVTVSKAERQRIAARHTRSLEAYDLFLRGQAALMTREWQQNIAARDLYRQAIARDPAFARAYAGIAMTHANDHRYRWTDDRPGALARALEIASTARQINPDLREVHFVLAYVHSRRLEHEQAIAALEQAITIDPSYADAYAFMGAVHCYAGRPEKSLPLLRYAMRLNPNAGSLYYLALGFAYFFLDDLDQALINLREAVARNPTDLETHVYLAAVYARLGDRNAAAWEIDEIRTLQPDFSLDQWLASSPLAGEAQKLALSASLVGYSW